MIKNPQEGLISISMRSLVYYPIYESTDAPLLFFLGTHRCWLRILSIHRVSPDHLTCAILKQILVFLRKELLNQIVVQDKNLTFG